MTGNDAVHDEAYRALVRLLDGAMAAQLVRAAATMSLADTIGDDAPTVEELASAHNVAPDRLRRMLRALTAIGICVEREAGRFALTEAGQLLRVDREDSAHAMVRTFTDEVILGAWPRLLYSVRTGDPAFEDMFGTSLHDYLTDRPDLAARLNVAIGQSSRAVADALPDAFDFGSYNEITDLGGGDGTVLASVLRRHPGLRGIVFDRTEAVAHQVAQTAGTAGVGDRCVTVVGNFFDGVPKGSDLHLLKNVLHEWDDDRAATVLERSRAALPDHGRLLIVESVLPEVTPAGADPGPYLSDLTMMLLVGGRERTRADFVRLCARAGFRVADLVPLTTSLHLIEAAPAYG